MKKIIALFILIMAMVVYGYTKKGQVDVPANGSSSNENVAVDQVVGGIGRIDGTVTDENGRALLGASIRIDSLEIRTSSGPGGSFVIDSLPPGSHLLRIASFNRLTALETVTISVDQAVQRSFVLIRRRD